MTMVNEDAEVDLRITCKILYYAGFGDFWFKNKKPSRIVRTLNDILFYIIVIICYVSIGMEVPVIFSDNFSSAEKNDVINFTFGPSTVVAKWVALVNNRKNVMELLSAILDESLIKDEKENAASQKKQARLNIKGFACCVTGAVFFYTFVGVQKLIAGEPFYAVYTIWPPRVDVSTTAQLIRLFYLIALTYQMVIMVVVDGLSIILMIKLTHKFKTLIDYFKGLRSWFEDNEEGKTAVELEKEFRERFVTGLKFHSHILGCSKKVQHAFAVQFALTISQTSFMVAVSLSRFMVTEHDFLNIIKSVGMIAPLLTMLGIYMAHAGDISDESSKVAEAMFDSGWELCRHNQHDMRPLLLLGSQQGQIPFTMQAFGTFKMSYSAFVSVVKTSYSLFAVLY